MRIAAAAVLAAMLPLVVTAAEVAGVKLEDKVRIAPSAPELVLNGAGVRTRFVVKVYVAGLYLAEKKSTAADVLALGGAKRIAMTMLRDLTAQQISGALNDGFNANNPPADHERYRSQLGELSAILNSLGALKKGDVLAFDYVPDVGMRVLVNGEPKGNPIPDEGFYRGLLRAWLGDKPVDADLKKALLGQS